MKTGSYRISYLLAKVGRYLSTMTAELITSVATKCIRRIRTIIEAMIQGQKNAGIISELAKEKLKSK